MKNGISFSNQPFIQHISDKKLIRYHSTCYEDDFALHPLQDSETTNIFYRFYYRDLMSQTLLFYNHTSLRRSIYSYLLFKPAKTRHSIRTSLKCIVNASIKIIYISKQKQQNRFLKVYKWLEILFDILLLLDLQCSIL